jgi:hypothetical protein
MNSGRWEDARRLYTDILQEQVKTLGELHPSVFDARERLAAILGRMGRLDDALAAYRKLLQPTHDQQRQWQTGPRRSSREDKDLWEDPCLTGALPPFQRQHASATAPSPARARRSVTCPGS